jgi:hypothetical protein
MLSVNQQENSSNMAEETYDSISSNTFVHGDLL